MVYRLIRVDMLFYLDNYKESKRSSGERELPKAISSSSSILAMLVARVDDGVHVECCELALS